MYTVDVKVVGVAPLLQNRFPMPEFADMSKGGKKKTGSTDYTEEWRDKFYANKSGIFQPASHFEAALVKTATSFTIQGRRGKTYKDLFKASVFVTPEEIPFNLPVLEDPLFDADAPVYLTMYPVIVNRARVVRIRPALKAGWELSFQIECIDDQISAPLLQDVLTLAGKTCGVGDWRPRFGRFNVAHFEVVK